LHFDAVKFDPKSAKPWGQYYWELVSRFVKSGKGLSATQCGNIAGDCLGGADGKQDFIKGTEAASLFLADKKCTAQTAKDTVDFYLSIFADRCKSDLKQRDSKVANMIALMKSRKFDLAPFIDAKLIADPQALAKGAPTRKGAPPTTGSAPPDASRVQNSAAVDSNAQGGAAPQIAQADMRREAARPSSTANAGAGGFDPFGSRPPDLGGQGSSPAPKGSAPPNYYDLGLQYYLDAQYDKALDAYDEAIRRDPKNAAAYNSRAWLRATCTQARYRDGKRAREDAIAACDLTEWKDGGILDTLAAACAESGSFDEAVRIQTAALKVASDDLKEGIRSRLALYKASQPYRETPQR
jgi:tetratricopeptide (TPR) repeat protein